MILLINTCYMNKFLNSAIKVLSEMNIPLHTKIITELALSKWYLKTEWKTPHESMWAVIYTDIKNKWSNSHFIKVKASTFKINKNINNTLEEKILKKWEYSYEELEIIFSLPPTKDNIKKLSKILKRSYRAIEQQYQWALLSDSMIDEKNKEYNTNWNKNMKCREVAKKMGWIKTY